MAAESRDRNNDQRGDPRASQPATSRSYHRGAQGRRTLGERGRPQDMSALAENTCRVRALGVFQESAV
jgi:hypothetical protein